MLAVVICAIALSLAYPVREYVAQRRQIDQLVAEQQMMQAQVKSLIATRDKYSDPVYITQIAEQELHMCLPSAQCYVVENGQSVIGAPKRVESVSAPWYAKLWESVQESDSTPPATPAAGSKATAHPSGGASGGPAATRSPAAGGGKASAGSGTR